MNLNRNSPGAFVNPAQTGVISAYLVPSQTASIGYTMLAGADSLNFSYLSSSPVDWVFCCCCLPSIIFAVLSAAVRRNVCLRERFDLSDNGTFIYFLFPENRPSRPLNIAAVPFWNVDFLFVIYSLLCARRGVRRRGWWEVSAACGAGTSPVARGRRGSRSDPSV